MYSFSWILGWTTLGTGIPWVGRKKTKYHGFRNALLSYLINEEVLRGLRTTWQMTQSQWHNLQWQGSDTTVVTQRDDASTVTCWWCHRRTVSRTDEKVPGFSFHSPGSKYLCVTEKTKNTTRIRLTNRDQAKHLSNTKRWEPFLSYNSIPSQAK